MRILQSILELTQVYLCPFSLTLGFLFLSLSSITFVNLDSQSFILAILLSLFQCHVSSFSLHFLHSSLLSSALFLRSFLYSFPSPILRFVINLSLPLLFFHSYNPFIRLQGHRNSSSTNMPYPTMGRVPTPRGGANYFDFRCAFPRCGHFEHFWLFSGCQVQAQNVYN